MSNLFVVLKKYPSDIPNKFVEKFSFCRTARAKAMDDAADMKPATILEVSTTADSGAEPVNRWDLK